MNSDMVDCFPVSSTPAAPLDSPWRLCVLIVLILSGCQDVTVPPEAIASAQEHLDAAREALASQDYGSAEGRFSEAIALGGLDPDQIAEALLGRAESRFRIGDLPAALIDLDEAEQGASDLWRVHQIRAGIQVSLGDVASARSEFLAARRLNPNTPRPDGL